MIAYINLGENMHQSEIKLTKRLKIKRVDVNKVKEQQKKVLECGAATCGGGSN